MNLHDLRAMPLFDRDGDSAKNCEGVSRRGEVRSAGMRAVVRFSYSNPAAAAVLDPPKAQILDHITSLQARPRASRRSFDAWVVDKLRSSAVGRIINTGLYVSAHH